MLIKKYTTTKHKILSNNVILSKEHLQLSTSPVPPPLPKISSSSYTAAGVTSCYTHHRRYDRWNQQRTCTVKWYSWCCLSSLLAILGVIVLPLARHCEAYGYSYTRFTGPVSGPEHRVYLRDHDNSKRGEVAGEDVADGDDQAAHLDYIAKPEYEFAYGVKDAQARILHTRNEMRDGDAVKGVYSVVDPDGTLRVVKYTADDINGFRAEVIMNGISSIHGQLQPDTPTTISNLNTDTNNRNNENQYQVNTYPSNTNNAYKHHYYPTPAPQDNPPTSIITDYNEHNDYDDGQDSNYNGDDYQPQYEVHENSSNEDDGDDDHDGDIDNGDDDNSQDEEDKYKVKKDGKGDKKYDYYDDEEKDVDEYDDSDEVEDYDEATKNNNEASEDSDEYY